MLSSILGDFLPIILLVMGGIGAIFGYGVVKKKQGRKKAEQKMKEADHADAAKIRDNVERNLDKRVRKLDDAGFRD